MNQTIDKPSTLCAAPRTLAVLTVLVSFSGCGVLNSVTGKNSNEVQPTSDTNPGNVVAFGTEDETCQSGGSVTAPKSARIWEWNGSSASPLEVTFDGKIGDGNSLATNGVIGSLYGRRTERNCTRTSSGLLECGKSEVSSEGVVVKICRENAVYGRESIETITLTTQYHIDRAWKLYSSLKNHKGQLLGAYVSILQGDIRRLPDGQTRAVVDNASFGVAIKVDSKKEVGLFSVYPTSKDSFAKSPLHLWEVPFVISHEYGHNVFYHHTGSALATVGLNVASGHGFDLNHILPMGERQPQSQLAGDEIETLALKGLNELFADLFAYYANGAKSGQLRGVTGLDVTRDPASPVTFLQLPKQWGKGELDIFEGRRDASKRIGDGEPNFAGEHDVAAVLGYPVAYLMDAALKGADTKVKLDTLIQWLGALSNHVVRRGSLKLDPMTALLVETIVKNKTASANDVESACKTFRGLVSGLEASAAACRP